MDVPSIMDYGLDLTASRDHVMEDRNGLLESIWLRRQSTVGSPGMLI